MRLAALAAAVLAAAPAAGQAPAIPIDSVFSEWSRPDGPGCAVGIARNGRTILTRAYGSADLEHATPNRPDTVFEAGSVSKQFTAAAILLLVRDGRIALGDDVRKYVPELPDYGETITIDQLLSHTNGLREWSSLVEAAGWPRTTRFHSNADALAVVLRQRALNHAPGAEHSYTNSGYVLLTAIVERVSGLSLPEFTRTRLFEPLGMRRTRWRDDFRRVEPGRAIAYRRPERGGGWEQAMPFEDVYGPGAVLTTVGDLLVWNEALASGRLGADLTRQIEERARLDDGRQIEYARGVSVTRFRGTEEVAHSGATAGYRAWLGRWPAHRLSVAVLCNAGAADATALAHAVAERLLPPPEVELGPAPAVAASHDLAPRAGLFVSQLTGRPFRLEVRNGRLAMVEGPELTALAPDRFDLAGQEVRFVTPDSIELLNPDVGTIRFLRSDPYAPGASDLEEFTGRYASDEVGAIYRVRAAEGGLVVEVEGAPRRVATLRPVYRDAFMAGDSLVRFRRSAGGRVVALSLGMPRLRDLAFRRLPAERRDAATEVDRLTEEANALLPRLFHCSAGRVEREVITGAAGSRLELLRDRAGLGPRDVRRMSHPPAGRCRNPEFRRLLAEADALLDRAEAALPPRD